LRNSSTSISPGVTSGSSGDSEDSGEIRVSEDGTIFEEATNDQVIIRRPGQKPAIGHPPSHPGYTRKPKK